MAWWKFWQRNSIERPAELPTRPSGPRARALEIFDHARLHPGIGLTAAKVRSAYLRAEQGFPAEQCDLFDDVIEGDAHLRGQLEGRLLAVAGKDAIVQAGGDDPASQDAARALDEALAGIPNVTEMVVHQLKAVWYGWSGTEIHWERRDGIVKPVWFANVPHRRFRFDSKNQPRLLTSAADVEGEALRRGQWMFEALPGTMTVRTGIMRTATWFALFKRLAVRDWQVFSERFGMPYVVGRYQDNADEKEKEVLEEAVKNLGKDGGAIFSQLMDIEMKVVEAGGKAHDVHGAIVEWANRELSKLISGATLTAETQGPGSFALGRVHQNRAFDLVQADEMRLGMRFQVDVGAAFVAFNGSIFAGAKPPRLKIHVTPEMDPETRMEIYSKAANELGMELDGEQIRQEFRLKAPRSGGEIVRGTQPEPGADPEPESQAD